MNIQEIEKDLSDKMDQVMALGWTFCTSVTTDHDNKKCCALGSVEVLDKTSAGWFAVAQDKYGLSTHEAWAFVNGFDGDPIVRLGLKQDMEAIHPYYELGRRLRDKYQPIKINAQEIP